MHTCNNTLWILRRMWLLCFTSRIREDVTGVCNSPSLPHIVIATLFFLILSLKWHFSSKIYWNILITKNNKTLFSITSTVICQTKLPCLRKNEAFRLFFSSLLSRREKYQYQKMPLKAALELILFNNHYTKLFYKQFKYWQYTVVT